MNRISKRKVDLFSLFDVRACPREEEEERDRGAGGVKNETKKKKKQATKQSFVFSSPLSFVRSCIRGVAGASLCALLPLSSSLSAQLLLCARPRRLRSSSRPPQSGSRETTTTAADAALLRRRLGLFRRRCLRRCRPTPKSLLLPLPTSTPTSSRPGSGGTASVRPSTMSRRWLTR